jgi:hypothetical protein
VWDLLTSAGAIVIAALALVGLAVVVGELKLFYYRRKGKGSE